MQRSKGLVTEITTTVDGFATATATGKITVATAPDLHRDLMEALHNGTRILRLEMEGVEYISSAGLRVLIQTMQEAQRISVEFQIAHPTNDVFDVFEMTGLDQVLPIER